MRTDDAKTISLRLRRGITNTKTESLKGLLTSMKEFSKIDHFFIDYYGLKLTDFALGQIQILKLADLRPNF